MAALEELCDKIFKDWGNFAWDSKELYVSLVEIASKERGFHVDNRKDPFQRLMWFLLEYHCKGIVNRLEVMSLLENAVRLCEPPSQKRSLFAVRRKHRFSRLNP